MLSFAEDSNVRITPIGIRAISVRHYNGLGLVRELRIFIEVYAIDKKVRIEGNNSGRISLISETKGMKQSMAERKIRGRYAVRKRRRTKTKSTSDGHFEKERVVTNVMFGCT